MLLADGPRPAEPKAKKQPAAPEIVSTRSREEKTVDEEPSLLAQARSKEAPARQPKRQRVPPAPMEQPIPAPVTVNAPAERVESETEGAEKPGPTILVAPKTGFRALPPRGWRADPKAAGDLDFPKLEQGAAFSSRDKYDSLLKGGEGRGPVTGAQLQARVQHLVQLDAQILREKHRADMGIAHPRVQDLTHRFKDGFNQPALAKIESFGIAPDQQSNRMLSDNLGGMLELDAEIGGLEPGNVQQHLARATLAANTCTFRYFELGWISLRLNQAGEVLGTAIYQSSGRRAVDDYLTQTLLDAAPFTALPAEALNGDGEFLATWEVGYRDYSASNCRTLGEKVEALNHMHIQYRGAFY